MLCYCHRIYFAIYQVPPTPHEQCYDLVIHILHHKDPLLCHHDDPLVLFTLPILAVRLDLQIQAPIISSSSSEKFGVMIDEQMDRDLGAAA